MAGTGKRAWLALAAVAGLASLAAMAVTRQRTAAPRLPSAPAAVVEGQASPGPEAATRVYTVVAGDTLGAVAAQFGTTVEALMELNGIADADDIVVGQELRLRVTTSGEGPATRLVPDRELVYGPSYADFDPTAYAASVQGPLAGYQEIVNGETVTGPAIVGRIARDFSVGPRVLLAFVEARSGWVTGSVPADGAAGDYPAGLEDPARVGLWLQLNWLADRLNGGYYDWKTRGNGVLTLRDGVYLQGHPSLGPGSFAVQRALGFQSTSAELPGRLAAFDSAYRKLFGDPWGREASAGDPASQPFPKLDLPWSSGERWWMTGGPHGGWADGSAWAAFDFVPDGDPLGCAVSAAWVTAVADGLVMDAGEGALYLDLDGDGRRQTGPGLLYLHLAAADRAAPGARVLRGDRLGHASCEGGASSATHLHIARLRDGEWLAATGAQPFVMAGWSAVGADQAYDGGLENARHGLRQACECRQEGYNDVVW